MTNKWIKQIDKHKILDFLTEYFFKKNQSTIFNMNFVENGFVEIEIVNDITDYFKTYCYLGDYFVVNPSADLNNITESVITENMENFQDLNQKWINFIYKNTKNIKIDNKTYKEFLYNKLEKNLLSFYENNIAFVINNYLKNENGFTESATIATIKEFKKEYDKEKANLPFVINALLGENNNKENIQ